jgi:serine carboxypeptidase-like clade 2
MLYVESPIGVGFSYSITRAQIITWGTIRRLVCISLRTRKYFSILLYIYDFCFLVAAEDNLRFIVNWLEEFPNYKDSELFLIGESYAGK